MVAVVPSTGQVKVGGGEPMSRQQDGEGSWPRVGSRPLVPDQQAVARLARPEMRGKEVEELEERRGDSIG